MIQGELDLIGTFFEGIACFIAEMKDFCHFFQNVSMSSPGEATGNLESRSLAKDILVELYSQTVFVGGLGCFLRWGSFKTTETKAWSEDPTGEETLQDSRELELESRTKSMVEDEEADSLVGSGTI